MRCIVTGGAGFIGSNLVDKLVSDGHEVIIFDNYSTGKKENVNPKAKFFLVDISHEPSFKSKTMKDIMTGVDVVFHLAAMTSVEESIHSAEEYHKVNVFGTLNMLKACVKYEVQRFIFSSSSAVYGEPSEFPTKENSKLNPMSPYAMNKLMGEQYCKMFSDLYGLETACLRYANVFGNRQRNEGAYCNVIGIFNRQKVNSEKLTIVGDGEQLRDFINVNDVVDANIKVMDYPMEVEGDVYNVGSGKNYSVNQIAEWIGGEPIHIAPRIEPRVSLLDNNKLNKVFKWTPKTDLENWIKNTKPVSRKQAEERLKHLKSELTHEGYHDGWTLKGMREEKEWIEKELKKA